MTRWLALALLCCVPPWRTVGAAGLPGELHDVPRLTWLTPGFLPDRGLLTVGLSGSRYHPGFNPTGGPAHYDVNQAALFVHWSPLAHVAVSGQQSWRSWSRYQVPGQEPSGGGLADGDFRLAVSLPGLPDWLGLAVYGGGNIPVGADELTEGVFSPEAGGTVSLAVWRHRQAPQMRLHASAGWRWNRNEQEGFGAGLGPQPQPWYPLYPSAAAAGGERANDLLCWGVALEFRQRATALWIEWTGAMLYDAVNVGQRENQQILAAGLIWGLREGWALQCHYQVGLWLDDVTTPWYPRLPHIGFTIGVSRQFRLG